MNYCIKAFFPYSMINPSLGLVESTLCENLQWATATSSPANFRSVQIAIDFAKRYQIVKRRPKLGTESCPFIKGPRGGVYSIFTGRRQI